MEIILTGQNHDCVSCSAKVYYHTIHLLKSSSKEHYNIQFYTLSLIVAMRWYHWYPWPNKGNVKSILICL